MRRFLLCFLPIALQAFQEKPWLEDQFCCQFNTEFTYSRYRYVDGAVDQLRSASNDKEFAFDFGATPSTRFDIQLEAEFADTPRQSLGMRSVGLQARGLLLDDVAGDPFSWTAGLLLRKVNPRSIKDISCPYSGKNNLEVNTAIGKEWSRGALWITRLWGLIGAGFSSYGSPWIRTRAVYEKNWNNRHRFGLFADGYFGFGNKQHVSIDHFHGWGIYHHQSVDLGTLYRYHTDTWGELTVAYTRRVYAHVFPENVNFFTIGYHLPFSFF